MNLIKETFEEVTTGRVIRIKQKLTKEEQKLLKSNMSSELNQFKKEVKQAEIEKNYILTIQIYKKMLKTAEEQGIKLNKTKIQRKIENLEKKIGEISLAFDFKTISI